MGINAYRQLKAYYGDLHNHCAIGYGHGSVEDAFQNAKLQLDFACITAHAHWPDLPKGDPRLEATIAYHQEGFKRTAEAWTHFQQVVEANNQPDRFVTFLGFEWHSMHYGDHHVCFNGSQGEVLRADTLEGMRQELRRLAGDGIEGFIIPHHIGYKTGYRGINWETFSPEFTPVVEIISMHGGSESDEGPYPILHTMGPRDWRSTYQYGLAQRNIAGVVGSTDHHSAHPGSYGHGRAGVWASGLTRDEIWEAIKARRTYALTGDRILLAFALNGAPMGSVVPPTAQRSIEVYVEGGDTIDYVEVLRSNQVLRRWDCLDGCSSIENQPDGDLFKVYLELGWGEKNQNVDWQVALDVTGGKLVEVEPRFRGHEVVAPQAGEEEKYAFSSWEQQGDTGVRFTTRTWGNPTTTTASTQGMCLEIAGDADTRLAARLNNQTVEVSLGELMQGSKAGYLGGFLTPAYRFHRAVPQREYTGSFTLQHESEDTSGDWYYVRVRQKNGQWAWSSPIWITAGSPD